MSHQFLGPVWPIVGPDFSEPFERFRLDVLRRECSRDPRVVEYLKKLAAQKRLLERVADLEARLQDVWGQLGQLAQRERPPIKRAPTRGGGVPL